MTPGALLEAESLGDKVYGFMELNIRNIENKYFHTIMLFSYIHICCSPSINHGSIKMAPEVGHCVPGGHPTSTKHHTSSPRHRKAEIIHMRGKG